MIQVNLQLCLEKSRAQLPVDMLIPDFEGIVIQLGSEKSQFIMLMQLLSGGQGGRAAIICTVLHLSVDALWGQV